MKVHVVWEPVLGGDLDRARAATRTIDGPNVTHYWDAGATTGRWAERNWPWPQLTGPAWDVYYLFDGGATWGDSADQVVATGYTIVGERRALADGLARLLG